MKDLYLEALILGVFFAIGMSEAKFEINIHVEDGKAVQVEEKADVE